MSYHLLLHRIRTQSPPLQSIFIDIAAAMHGARFSHSLALYIQSLCLQALPLQHLYLWEI